MYSMYYCQYDWIMTGNRVEKILLFEQSGKWSGKLVASGNQSNFATQKIVIEENEWIMLTKGLDERGGQSFGIVGNYIIPTICPTGVSCMLLDKRNLRVCPLDRADYPQRYIQIWYHQDVKWGWFLTECGLIHMSSKVHEALQAHIGKWSVDKGLFK